MIPKGEQALAGGGTLTQTMLRKQKYIPAPSIAQSSTVRSIDDLELTSRSNKHSNHEKRKVIPYVAPHNGTKILNLRSSLYLYNVPTAARTHEYFYGD
jgi:hypothetical protein